MQSQHAAHQKEVIEALNGLEYRREDGYWYKVQIWEVAPSKEVPHGIRYNLTLHDTYNRRIFGMDNAHGVNSGRKFSGRRYEYDHLHKTGVDKGTPYDFENLDKCCQTIFNSIDEKITAHKQPR